MSLTDYTPPVSQLISLGDVRETNDIDYLALGLGPDHVPELCRMMVDEELWWADSESVEVWSAVHAWRALAQIGSPDAIPALVALMGRIDAYEDDWTGEELPDVFAAIGPVALPALTRFLADQKQGVWARITCAYCFETMVKAHPETQAECTGIIMRQLGQYDRQTPTLNGFLISPLLDWQATEAAPVIEAAFKADRVDPSVCGDWEDVQIGLGLLSERITPAPRFFLDPFQQRLARHNLATPAPRASRADQAAVPSVHSVERRQRAKAKQKRKQEKQSRRKQRK